MKLDIDTKDIERYVDMMDPQTKATVEKALSTTLHYIMGLRNGACYRYQKEIQDAVDAFRKRACQCILKRTLERANEA